jgi:hypothetical protein
MQQYVAAAKATDAWLCARRSNLTDALRLSGEALSEWASYAGVYPFHWLALLPRLEAQLAMDATAGAIESCRALLAPTQRRLPSAGEELVTVAIQTWEAGDELATRRLVRRALASLASHLLQ